jgi:hypothetical protein
MTIKGDLMQTERLPDGDQINITYDNEITRCYYSDQDNNILLAEIDNLKQKTTIYPTNTRVGSPLFQKSKYSINFVFEGYDVNIKQYEYEVDEKMLFLSGLPEIFIKTLRYGLGIKKEYKYIPEVARYIDGCKYIIVSSVRESCIDGENIIISDNDIDKLRRGIGRIVDLFSNASLQSRRLFVYNELLHDIDGKRFPERKISGQRDVIYRIVKDTDFNRSISQNNKKAIREIKDNIDSSYFTVIKNDFDGKINGDHKEEVFQNFFQSNPLLLTMFSGSPYVQFNNKAYVGGKSFDNKNGQYPDFLYKHKLTNNNFIIEIKCPRTPLLEKTPYRKTGVYSPSKELSGAISQILTQKYQLETDISSLIKNADDRDVDAYNVQGLVIIGLLNSFEGDDIKAKKRSFELYRNNQKNLRIMTYDECQEQLNYFLTHIN